MSPAEQYAKARRNLVLFLGLLALSVFVGVSQRDGAAVTILPFELQNPEHIPHVLAAIAFYSLYNFGISWALLDEESRAEKIRLVDLVLIAFSSSILLAVYAFLRIGPVLPELEGVSEQVGAAIAVAATFTISALSLFWQVRSQRRWRENVARMRASARREVLTNILITGHWALTFNPQLPNGKKRIEFIADGSIGDGRNRKESTWEIEGDELVIRRENGALQNRFRYDDQEDHFVSTDDPAAGAVEEGFAGQKSQSIARVPEPPWQA